MIDGSIILFKELYKDYHEIFRVEITSLGLALCVLLQKYKFIYFSPTISCKNKIPITKCFLDLIAVPSNILEIFANYDNGGVYYINFRL